MKARVFNIMQYEKHPITKEPLLSEDKIKEALDHKSIKQWAYIIHDKDVYSKDDEVANGYKQGDEKPKHFHIVCKCERAVELSIIANWFGISENFIDVPKGRGAFGDCVEYLTHSSEKQQSLGKHKYDDEEVISNFDLKVFKETSNMTTKERMQKGIFKSIEEEILYKVSFEGLKPKEVKREHFDIFQKNRERILKSRKEYLSEEIPLPTARYNYYIQGGSGMGKGFLSRAIARSIYPNLKDEDLFYEIGSENVSFDGYDGQPIIIWNDCRAQTIIKALGSIGNVFDVFDTQPTNRIQNIKFGSVRLVNSINIVNSIQTYREFLDAFVETEKHERAQSYRRFPFVGVVREEDFYFMVNNGFIEEGSYFEYSMFASFKANMKELVANEKKYNDENLIIDVMNANSPNFINDKILEIEEKRSSKIGRKMTEEERKAFINKCQCFEIGDGFNLFETDYEEEEKGFIDCSNEEGVF